MCKFRLSKSQQTQLNRDRLSIFVDLLNTATAKDVVEELGKPYFFRHSLLKREGSQQFDEVPNAESVRVLTSPYVQVELKCSKEQVEKIVALAKSYKRQGYLPKEDIADEDIPEPHVQKRSERRPSKTRSRC